MKYDFGEKLEKIQEVNDARFKSEAGKLARDVLDYADKKCYGLGECGYYFREWAPQYTESEDPEYIKRLILEAETVAERLDDIKKEYGA